MTIPAEHLSEVNTFCTLQLYVGGAPNHMERGITVRPNFQGCLENVLYISPSSNAILDIFQNLQRQSPFYGLEQGMVGSGAMCEVSIHPSIADLLFLTKQRAVYHPHTSI